MAVSLKSLAPQVGATLENLVQVCQILEIPVQEVSGQKIVAPHIDKNGKQIDPVVMLKKLAELAQEKQLTLVEAAQAVVSAQNQQQSSAGGIPAMFSDVIERLKGTLTESAIDIRLQGEQFLEEKIVELSYIPADELRRQRQGTTPGVKKDNFTDFFSQSRLHSSLDTWATAPALAQAATTQTQQLPQSQELNSKENSSES